MLNAEQFCVILLEYGKIYLYNSKINPVGNNGYAAQRGAQTPEKGK
jgi:hypothetical protein